jgi:hypothetical protein
MKQIVHSKLFSLLAETTKQIPASEFEKSYDAFANEIFAANAKSNNPSEFLNSLCYARAELACLQEQKQSKKICLR